MADVTMQQIADLAGVSRTTVSRALFEPDKVRPETRETILDIMNRFGYTYHAGAAELTRRKSLLIGLIIPSVISPAFANTILQVQEAATELGMSLILGCSEFSAHKEEAVLNQFLTRRVAGVILLGHAVENESHILRLQASGIPCVVIWTSPNNPHLCQAGFDNAAAATAATEYLIGMGHKRIALITGPRGSVRRVEDRVEGYVAAMRAHRLPVRPAYLRSAEPTIGNGERETIALLDATPPPTAIFAASDMLAIGALSAARIRGLRVPDHLSVMGFDNIEFAAHTDPPLTTVAVPEREMSHMAIQMMKGLINHEITPPKSYRLDTQIIVRKSCRPPPRR
ncbi:MAG: LacI family transcriptional regulator [Planctomycetes bacterium]|nr:LacI family transcriptional regulator [Planctomycetota bacterium]